MMTKPTGWGIALASLVLMLPYALSLSAPFDFVDDGCLVYPTPGPFLETVVDRTTVEFSNSGPFRPTTWLRWEGASRLFGENALGHRLFHFAWGMVSIGLFLIFLLEAGISWPAALLTGAAAMVSPLRNEIWVGMGLTEAFGFPFVMVAWIAALRGFRQPERLSWDLLGWSAALLALGCKNTFAPIVPVQMFLRITGGTISWREGWRLHGFRALLLSTTLLLPISHFLAYRLLVAHKPEAYHLDGIGPGRIFKWVVFLLRSGNITFLGAALVLWAAAWKVSSARPEKLSAQSTRTLMLAGLLMALGGLGVYLPFPGRSGRYTLPAVWGLDLMLAVVLTHVAALPWTRWKWAGNAAFALGLAVALVSTLYKQDQYHARSRLLWQTLDYLKTHPGEVDLAWVGPVLPEKPDLGKGEGVHFIWHWEHHDPRPLKIQFITDRSSAEASSQNVPRVLVGGTQPPALGNWEREKTFSAGYLLGKKNHSCTLWRARESLD